VLGDNDPSPWSRWKWIIRQRELMNVRAKANKEAETRGKP